MRLSPEYFVQILYIFSLDLETFQVDVCVWRRKLIFTVDCCMHVVLLTHTEN